MPQIQSWLPPQRIPPDSLWAYNPDGTGVPLAFVYVEVQDEENRPRLSIFPSWALSAGDPMFVKLAHLAAEEFIELQSCGDLVRIDAGTGIKLPEEEEE